MKNIRTSTIAKIVSYTLVPILILVIILNMSSLLFYVGNQDDFNEYRSYVDTDTFKNDYYSNIIRAINIAENEKDIIERNKEITLNSNETNIVLNNRTEESKNEVGSIQYNFSSIRKYDVLLISKEGTIITNVEKTINTDTLEEIINYISNKKYFWKYDGEKVDTNIEKLSYENIVYSGLDYIDEKEYKVYTALKNEESAEFYAYNMLYNFVTSTYEQAPAVLIISSILLIISLIYILISIGHKNGYDGIYVGFLDKIPYEVIIITFIFLLGIEIASLNLFFEIIGSLYNIFALHTGITLVITMGIVIYLTLAVTGVTTLRRIKAHVFWKNTIIYKIINYILKGLFTNLNQTLKLILQYGAFLLISIILVMWNVNSDTFSLIPILFVLALWYYVFKKILYYINNLNKIRQKINNMYNGNIENPLNDEEFDGELKEVSKELNDISGGLLNAIEEATKSERLKTELITNVSHDIKTPLTSIINYVDLMKKENIENEKIKEYLEVLDKKSQRLKKLTEDLVEASRASSGNIKLNIEKLNVKELMKQVSGEFEDKFSKRGLEIIENIPKEDIYIKADSRYMYRIIENIYVNVSKYALENSRVYIDVEKQGSIVKIIVKNISKDKLNISVDELMQRFVRGDSSRTTEGSGLGISIASSLTELQKGKFNIYLDGDLFKVVIEFETE